MPNDQIVHLYVATYNRLSAARNDHSVLTRLYGGAVVHAYETTVVSRELDGRISIVTADSPVRGRAWIGLATGHLGGLLVPPFVLWDDTMGVDDSGSIGHFWLGLSHADVRIIAEKLRHCTAALIVISETTLPTTGNHSLRGTFTAFERRVASVPSDAGYCSLAPADTMVAVPRATSTTSAAMD